MSDVDDCHDGHDGTCGFCGTSVRKNFVTCTGCGATWKSVVNAWGALTIKSAFVVPFVLAFVVGTTARSEQAFTVTLFGAAIGMVVLGLCMRTEAWFR